MRHTSFISLLAVVYLLFIVVYYFYVPFEVNSAQQKRQLSKDSNPEINLSYPKNPKIEKFKFSMDFFKNLPIFVFAFTCHQNVRMKNSSLYIIKS